MSDKFCSAGARRLTGPRRLEILELAKQDRKAALAKANELYGASEGEIGLWQTARDLAGPSALKSKNLTAVARLQRLQADLETA